MVTIDCSVEDLCKLTRRKLSIKAIEELLEYVKAEIESQDGDNLRIKLEDTNLPYLWSTEGIARVFRGQLDVEKGIAVYKTTATNDAIKVDKELDRIRPCIAAFSAKGPAIDDNFIKTLIQFQEKLCDGFGMKRKKVSIGIYKYDDIKWPVEYKAVGPTSVKFTPLGHNKEYNLLEILETHDTGKKFASILQGHKKYPILMDSTGAVLSFPPIINSDHLGKIEPGDTELLVEFTGTDNSAVDLSCNILACAFADRGWTIRSVNIQGVKKRSTPTFLEQKIKLDIKHIESLTGLSLGKPKTMQLLGKMRYGTSGNNVIIPCYRDDIMHPVDIAEDVLISHGYNQVPDLALTTYTRGSTKPGIGIIDASRDIFVGMGYQETLNAVLSAKMILYNKMNHPDTGTVELMEYATLRYSVLRSWILPALLDMLSQNKHHDYPQKIFECGEVAGRKGKSISESEHIAFAHIESDAAYVNAQQVLDAYIRGIGLKYELAPSKNPSFIIGRSADVIVDGEQVGTIGEINPIVLDNFELRTPTIGGELNLGALIRKKDNPQNKNPQIQKIYNVGNK